MRSKISLVELSFRPREHGSHRASLHVEGRSQLLVGQPARAQNQDLRLPLLHRIKHSPYLSPFFLFQKPIQRREWSPLVADVTSGDSLVPHPARGHAKIINAQVGRSAVEATTGVALYRAR